jgi:hypothetical protein
VSGTTFNSRRNSRLSPDNFIATCCHCSNRWFSASSRKLSWYIVTTPRMRSTAVPAAAIGRDSTSSAGAASSVNLVRSESNIVWSALPTRMIAAASRISSGGVVRWMVART